MGIWCDYCKIEWGRLKNNQWHEKAKTQSFISVQSSDGQERHYCRRHMDEVMSWPDGTEFTMLAQLRYAKANRKAVVNV